MNDPILFFRLLVLWPYIDEYSRQHVEQLQAPELSDWDALKAVYKVLGLARDTTERLEDKTCSNRVACPEVSMAVCVYHGPTVPFRLSRSVELSSNALLTLCHGR